CGLHCGPPGAGRPPPAGSPGDGVKPLKHASGKSRKRLTRSCPCGTLYTVELVGVRGRFEYFAIM
ncbi:hypothetical protein ACFQ1S_20540, partial [Kibdelosporangium lantanae]